MCCWVVDQAAQQIACTKRTFDGQDARLLEVGRCGYAGRAGGAENQLHFCLYRSCNTCQLHAKARPKVPFKATWSTALLRHFDFNTVHMETGYGSLNYILQAIEPTINWIEAHSI
ncbi:hypothetical protein Hypma_005998 [Hypsizygus marmoreus]|uniref:Uncharacterized protein n=1 Tax=Hypsizygus marmoreus TaxID=39966 RepID=A0A369K8A5_HYPMA|nr:hypothetical protein Hypma_005998 [Hypsizygus marmoreus]